MSRAIVVGAGFAGLLAARVLRDHFARVTILDRDFLPSTAQFRAGAPQSRHVHQLLRSALDNMERILPGLTADLEAAGAGRLDIAGDIAAYLGTGWAPRTPCGIYTYGITREMLELLLRRRVLECPGVEVIEGCEITGLEIRDGLVAGVRFRWRSRPGSGAEHADLVVDASGQQSAGPEWLASAGWQAPEQELMFPQLGYASCTVELPPPANWKALYICALAPVVPRAGLVFPVENGKYIVTLSGSAGQHPPVSVSGFLDFAKSLAHPDLWNMLRGCRSMGSISGFVRNETCLRRYDDAALPEGLIFLGDAVARLNPVYGQGMAAAAMAAVELRNELERDGAALSHGFNCRFHRRSMPHYRSCWLISAAQDELLPGSRRSPYAAGDASTIAAVQHMLRNALRDPGSYLDLIRTSHLLQPVPMMESAQVGR